MKSVTETLLNHIHSAKQFLTIDLFTLKVNINGTNYTINLCDASQDLTIGGTTYLQGKTVIERSQTELTNELSVDSVTFSLALNHDVFTGIGDLQAAAHNGAIDHSVFTLKRAYFDCNSGQYIGVLDLFKGACQVTSAGGLKLQLQAQSDTTGMSQEFPVRKFYPQASYVTNSAGNIVYSQGDNNRSCMIPLKPNKGALI